MSGSAFPRPDASCDGGDLDCGSGLLLIIRNAMAPVPKSFPWLSASPESTAANEAAAAIVTEKKPTTIKSRRRGLLCHQNPA